ncbi:MAG: hypothetical protein WCJ84_00420 [Candidatus Peregrinibacteria bacterium]
MRNTTTFTLPVSEQIVEIVTYITAGEDMELSEVTSSSIQFSAEDIGDGNVMKKSMVFDPTATIKQKKKKIEVAIKKIGGQPFTWDLYNDLPKKDGDALFTEVEKLFPTTATVEDLDEQVKLLTEKKKELIENQKSSPELGIIIPSDEPKTL